VEQPSPRASSYRSVIEVIQWTIIAVFIAGAFYAWQQWLNEGLSPWRP
jgi:hypothetical protein